MSWRLQVRHRTGFHYAGPVVSSYNEARIMPLSTPEQLVIEAEVSVEPSVRTYRYWDYWGTLVHAFDIHLAHTELVVTGTTVVETSVPEPARTDVGWDELASAKVRERHAEYLSFGHYVATDDEVREAAAAAAEGRSPAETCAAVSEWVRGRLRYEKGVTSVTTSALHALEQGSGVCQDFAHLALALLRTCGIPSRYASGYLHPTVDAQVGATERGESHAWVEAWLGDWTPLDPTSGRPVAERHVVVGRARDYGDVSPLKGIYHGGPAEALQVDVELTRLA